MSAETSPEKESPKKLFLPSLFIAFFSIGISNAIITLLAVDIAKTFFGSATPSAVAAVSQLTTVNAVGEIVFAILLSILAVRFRYKPLLLVGIIFVVISAIGSFLAPTLLSLQLFCALEGGGSIIVSIMAITLIGDALPSNKKAKVVSYLISVSAMASLVVILLLGFIANVGGWRYDYLFLALPISAAGLILSSVMLPSKPREQVALAKKNPYVESLKQVLTNRSATACLFANILTVAGSQVAVFAMAFYRLRFSAPRDWTVGIYMVAVIIFIIAPLVAGRLVNKFGAKRIAVLSTILAAFFTMSFFFMPNLWVSITFDMVHVWFTVTAATAFVCLVLDQVPKFRGTMMSLNSIFNNVGNVIAPIMGGAILVFTNGAYEIIGLALGVVTIVGTIILIFFAKDPNRP
jgi:predicted MFS family arabinose efflux permease